jgi:hypothetical protein
MVDWYLGGCLEANRPKVVGKEYSGGMWVFDPPNPPKEYYNIHTCPYPEPLFFPNALGSGAPYALGALHAGVDVVKAVEIAAQLDVFSGGEIKAVDIPIVADATIEKGKGRKSSYIRGVINALFMHRG